MKTFNYFCACLSFLCSLALFAEEQQPQIERVGGIFIVKSISPKPKDFFEIVFEAKEKTGRFDVIRLESFHPHFAIKEGQELKISAEILSHEGASAEASQVLLFLPHAEGLTPVWILSKNAQTDDLRASKYLEMHAPQNDFRLL